ncbi:MAG: MoxR family ATPase [Gemmatimonadota bacterium]|nr:MoxR family ATPase [Gemmatimonadota bacterium]
MTSTTPRALEPFSPQSALARAPEIATESADFRAVLTEISRVIVGQQVLLERLLIGLLADGHLLLEGLPGLAKTLAVRTLAATIDCDCRRVQFTPDLLPADLIGTLIYNQRAGDFTVQKGPIFTNILLADEVNRAPAKVQSALLESMQERQVTIGGETHRLPDLFLVLATQNPLEHEGTYPLPEAQVDRFLFKLIVTYPSRSEEREIIDRMTDQAEPTTRVVIHPDRVLRAREIVRGLYVDGKIKEYVLDLVAATREPDKWNLRDLVGLVQFGASPRAGINLVKSAKAHAFLAGRAYVLPEDIKAMAHDTLRHRLIPTYQAEADGVTSDQMLDRLLAAVPVP